MDFARFPGCFLPFQAAFAAHRALRAHLSSDSTQRLAPLVNIDQRQHRKRAVSILGQPLITHLGKAPDEFRRQKRVLHLGSYSAFGGVGVFVPLAERPIAVSAFVSEVFSLGRFGFECILRATIGAVAIQPSFVAVLVKLPNCWLSCSLAAGTLALWIRPVALSTLMCAFMPKYHCPAL